VAIALVSLAVGPAQPATHYPPKPHAFWPPPVLSRERAIAVTVRVDSRGGGVFDTGSGVGVGAHVVLTNAHLTGNAVTLVTRCDDQLLAVDRIERADDSSDVAVVVATGPALLPVELAPDDPSPGDRVLLAGYPEGQLTLTEGRIEGTLEQPGGHVLRFRPEPAVGQSGSPMLDANGRIAGLAFARDSAGGQGLAIPASRLRTLLSDFRSRGVPVAALDLGEPSAAVVRSSPCP
jgi:S1-C subfamily serine protease